eukprot:TRINITY_DN22633_c0_g1_i1.p1 TRINITY_DN22633_c0_g1~~TRINITY_DN22633_c0_g1_i1.p1  ORF type:complete len:186 (+),score=35.78 TRINITY_DN22633_c0_g1_i1:155-712(+)
MTKKHRVGQFDTLVVSPFRRCLETAAILAKTLKVPRLRINVELGELRHSVRRDQKSAWAAGERPADGKVSYLDAAESLRLLQEHSDGTISSVEAQEGEEPRPEEDHSEGLQRFMTALRQVAGRSSQENERILVVAHGDTVDAATRAFANKLVYSAKECCWVCFEVSGQGTVTLAQSSGAEMMDVF